MFVTDGILSRSVRDTVAFYVGLESQRRAAASPRRRNERIAAPAAAANGGLRRGPRRTPVDAEVRDAVLARRVSAKTLGHTVDLVPCPSTGA